MANIYIDVKDSHCLTNHSIKRKSQNCGELENSLTSEKKKTKKNKLDTLPFVDTEDLTFQSSPSPDSSEVDINHSLINAFHYGRFEKPNLQTSLKGIKHNHECTSCVNEGSMFYASSIHSGYSQKVAKMMHKMGYKVSKGLGAEEQGSTIPIEYMKHSGRTGIGYSSLFPNSSNPLLQRGELPSSLVVKWLSYEGDEKSFPQLNFITQTDSLNIIKEAKFVDSNILTTLLANKSKLDIYESREDFLFARKRSNAFETIGKGIFQNRAAMKIANLDSMVDYAFTKWSNDYSTFRTIDAYSDISPFYFADLCAGPGGFSEYILYRLGWRAKGFGFTLRGECDFKLDEFIAGTPETFEPCYGILNDGDITKRENLLAFQKYVFEVSNKCGVALVMGDGGFSVSGQENSQEILSKQLILCQFLCATSILHEGGNFLCKTFDLFTIFSVNLIYLMYRCFYRISIVKPCTSRPANSERYIICNGFKLKEGKKVFALLLEVNDKINIIKPNGEDVSNFLCNDMLGEELLFKYIIKSNNLIANIQIEALQQLISFIHEKYRSTDFHIKMKTSCFFAWKIPEIFRSSFKIKCADPNIYFEEFCKHSNLVSRNLYNVSTYSRLINTNIDSLTEIHSWHCYPLYGKRLVLVSLGRDKIYFWDCANEPVRFAHISSIINQTLEIPANTILEVLLVDTFSFSGTEPTPLGKQFWVIDIYTISNHNVCNWSRLRRLKLIKLLYQVIHKPLSNYIPLRPILSFNLDELPNLLKHLLFGEKKIGCVKHACLKLRENSFVNITGIIFTRTIKHPWIARISKTHNKLYYFNTKTNISSFDAPKEATMDAYSGLKSRMIWLWSNPQEILLDNKLIFSKTIYDTSVIDSSRLTEFITRRL